MRCLSECAQTCRYCLPLYSSFGLQSCEVPLVELFERDCSYSGHDGNRLLYSPRADLVELESLGDVPDVLREEGVA